eukprot:471735_1
MSDSSCSSSSSSEESDRSRSRDKKKVIKSKRKSRSRYKPKHLKDKINNNKNKKQKHKKYRRKKRRRKIQTPTSSEGSENSDAEQPQKRVRSKKNERENKYKKMKVKELKDLCRNKGLKVGGNKGQLIQRLLGKDISTRSAVHSMLKAVGVENVEQVSKCLKKGIQQGYYKIDVDGDGLDVVIYKDQCHYCWGRHTVKMRDVLYQDDVGADCYNGPIKCEKMLEGGVFVTKMCKGQPEFDDGKGFNHCYECRGFGTCIGEWYLTHCRSCGTHYNGGHQRYGNCESCPPYKRRKGDTEEDDTEEDDDDCVIQ